MTEKQKNPAALAGASRVSKAFCVVAERSENKAPAPTLQARCVAFVMRSVTRYGVTPIVARAIADLVFETGRRA